VTRLAPRPLVLLVVAFAIACNSGGGQPVSPTASVPVAVLAPPSNILVGAGDIADCRFGIDEETARLLDAIPGTVFTAGDNAYETGSMADYMNCYEGSWGRHKSRTRPAPGNHEYYTPGAADYFRYFGANAGPPGLGYYSYDIAGWHILSLNSSVASGPGSAQYAWVKADLEANKTPCSAAYWHYPLFSSGYDGDLPHMKAIWALLQEHRTEFVVTGHAHNYERFAPQDANGVLNRERGIRQFVVGTAGSPLTELTPLKQNSEALNATTNGVLALTLNPSSYEWRFVAVKKGAFRDEGAASCF
jgi:hypothetical protein